MSSQYDRVPAKATVTPKPFTVNIPEETISDFKTLLKLSPLAQDTYESAQKDMSLGISMEWMKTAKAEWEKFDWRKTEAHINSFPNFIVPIKDTHEDGRTYDIHFAGLFSEREDAIPLIFLHGWPGSFLEFLPILSALKAKYTPDKLPYHVIAPSLPGIGFSSSPPLDRDFDISDIGRLLNLLMTSIGCTSYVAQGGDIGSKIGRYLGSMMKECRGLHINYAAMAEPANWSGKLTEAEKEALDRLDKFGKLGSGYAIEQATKPATIGFVLAASPVALLAWVGEKFIEWTDQDLPLETVLSDITLYWLTKSYPTSIYAYRQASAPLLGKENIGVHSNPKWAIRGKPFGYSWFPKELGPIPREWVAQTGDLSFYREHKSGGHFAALERPEALLADVEDFIKESWRS